jgi:hypothetical protein
VSDRARRGTRDRGHHALGDWPSKAFGLLDLFASASVPVRTAAMQKAADGCGRVSLALSSVEIAMDGAREQAGVPAAAARARAGRLG